MSSPHKTPFPASIASSWLSLVPPSKRWETASEGQKPMAWSLLLPGLRLGLATGRKDDPRNAGHPRNSSASVPAVVDRIENAPSDRPAIAGPPPRSSHRKDDP
ncbi:hypothetical protein CFIMG_002912RA [Ceratocystis fimbriata CBS 114723]|uniref:Uncharacterized protein n=1 Tax=Ceratocystis fimbriata CBS 114723 TaxID=1035309 RepID=A0A2C5X324_9PEZI|nr:hypothetical protein CFIMG_002912RA [Ceratocystis fimbriata CBS 114723]